ncbi:Coiled-coil domain-containing protein 17 isoform X1 [Aix galericulata]|nr:Coiled-coil domain-containing protein 17 isoform X1 [Aix galericulata]
MPQHGDRAEQRHILLLSGLPPAILGPRGLGRARGAPLGAILTPRERALLRATEPRVRSPQQPPASRLTKEVSSPTRGAGFVPSPVGLLPPPVPQGEPSQGHPRAPELLEAHKHHVAEIRARTQQLEQQRAGRRWRRFWGDGAVGSWGDPSCPPQGCAGAWHCWRRSSCGRSPAEPQRRRRLRPGTHTEGESQLGRAGLSTPPGEAPRLLPKSLPVAPSCSQLPHFHPRPALLPPAGPLAAEARALTLSYLRSGGHDAAILAQLLDLQVEATALEKRAARRTGKRQPRCRSQPGAVTPLLSPLRRPPALPAERPRASGTQDLDAMLLAVELENQRLEDELRALKHPTACGLAARRAPRAHGDEPLSPGSLAAQQQAEGLAQLQAEVGMLRRQAEGMGPRAIPPGLPPARALPGFLTVRAASLGAGEPLTSARDFPGN